MASVYDALSTPDLKKVLAGFQQHFDLACKGDKYRPPKVYLMDQIEKIKLILEKRQPFVPPKRKR